MRHRAQLRLLASDRRRVDRGRALRAVHMADHAAEVHHIDARRALARDLNRERLTPRDLRGARLRGHSPRGHSPRAHSPRAHRPRAQRPRARRMRELHRILHAIARLDRITARRDHAQRVRALAVLGRVERKHLAFRAAPDAHAVDKKLEFLCGILARRAARLELDLALHRCAARRALDSHAAAALRRRLRPRPAQRVADHEQLIRPLERLVERLRQRCAARVVPLDERTRKLRLQRVRLGHRARTSRSARADKRGARRLSIALAHHAAATCEVLADRAGQNRAL